MLLIICLKLICCDCITRKLRYYKEVINSNLEDQKYHSILTSSKKKINIAKIRTNSHEGGGQSLKHHGRKAFASFVSLCVLRTNLTFF